MLCGECHRAKKDIRRRHAPRHRHNTRVSLPITCAQCGENDTLEYMPKGKKLDELLCNCVCKGELQRDVGLGAGAPSKERGAPIDLLDPVWGVRHDPDHALEAVARQALSLHTM